MERKSEQEGRPRTAYLIAVGVAGVVVILVAVFFYNAAFSTDQGKVDRATLELRSAAELVGVNDGLATIAKRLNSDTAPTAQAKVRSAQKQIDKMKTLSESKDLSPELTSALNNSHAASQEIDRLADRLLISRKLRDNATRGSADRLLRAQKGLKGLVGKVAIAKPLSASMNALVSLIDTAVVDLKDEDALSDEAEKNADVTTALVDERAQDEQEIEKAVRIGVEREVTFLGETRFDVTKITGTHACENTRLGNALVLNSGTTTCEAIGRLARDVLEQKGNAPNGWLCGGLPISETGFTDTDLSMGSSCTSEKLGITFSIYNQEEMGAAEAAAQEAARQAAEEATSPGDGRCLDGYDWVHSYGVPNSGRCVVAEGDESES